MNGYTVFGSKRSFLVFGLILLFVPIFGINWAGAWTIDWTKYENTIPANVDSGVASTNGKVPLGSNTKGDDALVFMPSVIKEGDSTYKMWYAGYDGINIRIYYATSSNGLDWTKYDNNVPENSNGSSTNGKIPLGTAGKGDQNRVESVSVLKDGSTYKMWYAGYDGANIFRIYYATSSNGLDWTKYDNTVPANSDGTSTNGRIPLGTGGKGDVNGVYSPFVLKDGSTYKVWYVGYDAGNTTRVYHATSSNGLDWAKYTNAIPTNSDTTSTGGRIPLGTAGTGDDAGILDPRVIKAGNTYNMWYVGSDGTSMRVYYATSSNGLDWTKYNNTIPPNSDTTNSNSRLGLGTNTKGDDMYIRAHAVILDGERAYKMWYSGYDGGSYRLYYATGLGPPPAGTIFTFH